MTKTIPLESSNHQTLSLLERRHKFLGPAYRLFYKDPLHIIRGEGVWLFDSQGKRYLDMYNNVPHVGHCHPEVVEALQKQIALLNTHTRYLHENVLDYADRLLKKLPDDLDVAMFSCTGTEANELALRIARAFTGGTGLIVTENAYYGNSHAIAEISTEDNLPEDRSDYVVTVPNPDIYRGQYRDKNAVEHYVDHVKEAVKTLHNRGITLAAFIVDTIISSGGIVSPPPEYLKMAADIIQSSGGLFVADEVQAGFGRTGKHFWGFLADDFLPDIVTMGKPMGNGHPLAATITKREIIDKFADKTSYFNTFGGNPVSCSAGLAVLEILERENLQKNALDVGTYLIEGIRSIQKDCSIIGDVRGSGFFIAVELVEDRESRNPATNEAINVVNKLKSRGILVNTIGPDNNILKLRPPMVFNYKNADFFLEEFDQIMRT